jgi:ribose transport system substrate-binding protein/inositol transport system substrate-binding protein
VASNEVDSGTLETKEVCRLLGGKGDILIMVGDLANQAAVQRTQDIHDVIATPECSGLKVLDEQTASWDPVKGQDLMTNWIAAGHKPAAVIANNDNMAIGAIQAMKAAGWDMKTVVVAGIDATQEALAAMKAGDLDVTVFQNAAGQGKGALDAAMTLASGGKVEPKVYVPFELVTPENMDQYMSKN